MNNEPSVQKLFDLSGRNALLTGASGHLGRSMADALAEAGARVIVASRNAKTGAKVATALGGMERGKHFGVVMDHMDERSINRVLIKPFARPAKMDVLVCNGHEASVKISSQSLRRSLTVSYKTPPAIFFSPANFAIISSGKSLREISS